MLKIYDNDNPNRILDRYVVVIDGAVFTMSKHPLSPNGINNYYTREELTDLPLVKKPIKFIDLPNDVQQAVQIRINQMYRLEDPKEIDNL